VYLVDKLREITWLAKRLGVDPNRSHALTLTTGTNVHIFDVALGPHGDLYLADAGDAPAILWLSPERVERAVWSLPLYDSSMGGGPFGIGVDQFGRVYCADGRHNCIHVLSSSGEPLARWDGFRWPMGVAVDLAGQVFVADSDADRVVVLSLEGKKLNTWGTSGRAPGKFRTPMALDVGIDGHIYVLDQGNNRVHVFQTDGSFISSWRIAARGYDRLGNSRGIAVLDDGSVLVLTRSGGRFP
jgi:streptogramin lyase